MTTPETVNVLEVVNASLEGDVILITGGLESSLSETVTVTLPLVICSSETADRLTKKFSVVSILESSRTVIVMVF